MVKGTTEGDIEAEAGALTAIAAMKNVPIVIVGDMMTGMLTKVEAGDVGAPALAAGQEVGAGAREEGGTGVQLGKVVKRDVLKLHNGTGKGKRLKLLIKLVLILMIKMKVATMGMPKMVIIIRQLSMVVMVTELSLVRFFSHIHACCFVS